MDTETQLSMLDRILEHRNAGRGTDAAESWWERSVDAYTCPDRFAAERQLLSSVPAVVGLSNLVPTAGSYATVQMGDKPVLVTRTEDGSVAAMLNVCRHRGAEIASGCGEASRLSCPYHGWTYRLDGQPAARRRPEHFDNLPDEGLVRLPCKEEHGLIWVCPAPDGSIPENPLAGIESDFEPLDFADHRLFATSTFTRQINWKLVIDTFLEVYHVPVLHERTLGGLIHGDYSLFDAFGPHGRMVVTRLSIDTVEETPRSERSALPHVTIVWQLLPNTVVIFQQDHMQLYQAQPGSHPGESVITVSIHVPKDTEFSDEHWQKNYDLLIEVTDTEDFVTCAGMQRGFMSGAQDHITFGANEPTLQHFHQSFEKLLADQP